MTDKNTTETTATVTAAPASTPSASPAQASAAIQPAAAAPAADKFEARMRALEANANSGRRPAVTKFGDEGWMKASSFELVDTIKTGVLMGVGFGVAYAVAYGITKLVVAGAGGATKTE